MIYSELSNIFHFLSVHCSHPPVGFKLDTMIVRLLTNELVISISLEISLRLQLLLVLFHVNE